MQNKMKGKIFNAQEVQSILNRSKVMFREVIKRQPCVELGEGTIERGPITDSIFYWKGSNNYSMFSFGEAPYKVGQKIFCKESFLQKLGSTQLPSGEYETFFTGSEVEYVADGAQERWVNPDAYYSDYWKKRPAQHMKQEHSRLTLQIKSVGVNRLVDISEEDTGKEGSYLDRCECMPRKKDKTPIDTMFKQTWCHIHGQEFKDAWNATRKKPEEKFEANPWVWCVNFEIINN